MPSLNGPGAHFARQRLERGDFNADNPWEFGTADQAALLGDPADWSLYASYFLAIDEAEEVETALRFAYPFAKLVDGEVRVHKTAFPQIRDAARAAGNEEIAQMAEELMKIAEENQTENDAAGEVTDVVEGAVASSAGSTETIDGGGGGGGKLGDQFDDRKMTMKGHTREMPLGAQTRGHEIMPKDSIDWAERTVPIAFSSEEMVKRWFGWEILDHGAGVDLSRLDSGRAPLLVNHDPDDQAGVVESARVDSDRMGRASVRFGRSDRASVILQDYVDDIRTTVSFSYDYLSEPVHEGVHPDDGEPIYRIMDWIGYEISLENIPADMRAGKNRSHTAARGQRKEGDGKMGNENTPTPEAKAPEVDYVKVKSDAAAEGVVLERKRAASIRSLGKHARMAQGQIDKALADGMPFDDFVTQVEGNTRTDQSPTEGIKREDPMLGMSEKELNDYSFFRALRAMADPSDVKLRDKAKFELEMSDAAVEKRGLERKSENSFVMPHDVLLRGANRSRQQRTSLSVGTAGKGGNLVGTELVASEYIELLKDDSLLLGLGRSVTGLVGNQAWPKKTAAASHYWTAEGAGATEDTTLAWGQLTASPKSVGLTVPLTRNLLLQSSPSAEALVMSDFTEEIALACDDVGFNGGGTDEPSGILQGGSIASVAGAAPTHTLVMQLKSELAEDKALRGNLHFCTRPGIYGDLGTISKDSGSGRFLMDDNGTMLGYPVHQTTQIPDTIATNKTALILGNFNDLVFFFWAGLEFTVDRVTLAPHSIKVHAIQSMDVGLRRDESFAVMQALTP